MKIFGKEIGLGRNRRELAIVRGSKGEKYLSTVPGSGSGGWWSIIKEPFTGAWQRNMEMKVGSPLSHFAVYRCISIISQSIAKVPFLLKRRNESGMWKTTYVPGVNLMLERPNSYQNHIQFKECWELSKLWSGNTYVLKVRDNAGYVVALKILDPRRVTPLISDSGDVFYQLNVDNINGIMDDSFPNLVVPSREIIHDRMCPLFHPLVGISPMYAAAKPALAGLKIVDASSEFFKNSCQPGGILTAPGNISGETAASLKAYFEENFTGTNAGAIAVVGDDMKFESLAISAVDSQLIEQLKFSAEQICAAFGVPLYMVLGSSAPNNSNIEAQSIGFYNDCLQYHIESMEWLMDEALEFRSNVPNPYGVELDLGAMFRMDTLSRYKTYTEAMKAGWMSPNEARAGEDRDPVVGGESPMAQQQNYSLAALAKRDAQEDPFSTGSSNTPTIDDTVDDVEEEDEAAAQEEAELAAEEEAKRMMEEFTKSITEGLKHV